MPQGQRMRCMNAFRSGQVRVLVATDVAARGLDIVECDLIVQVEPTPHGIDSYVHRSGRTGRAGRPGLTVTLYDRMNSQHREHLHDVARLVPLQELHPQTLADSETPPNHYSMDTGRRNDAGSYGTARPRVWQSRTRTAPRRPSGERAPDWQWRSTSRPSGTLGERRF